MAWQQGKNSPIFGVSLTPKFVSGRMTRFLGTTVEGIAAGRSPKKRTDFEKNLSYWSSDAFDLLGFHVSSKISDAFIQMKDPTTGKKWKKLAPKTIRARLASGKPMSYPTDPLYFTGKLAKIATGSRLKTRGGGSGMQKSGNIRSDGIQLTIRNNYKVAETMITGSYMWRLDGPKARHLYGYTEKFNNVYRGKKLEKKDFVVPARPFVPMFTNSFYSKWKKSIRKEMANIIVATEKNSPIVTKSYEPGRVK
jgi:hypothetical protein